MFARAPDVRPLLARRNEVRDFELVVITRGLGTRAVIGPAGAHRATALAAAAAQSQTALLAVDLSRHTAVDRPHVAEQALGVRAQGIAHLAQVRDELEAFAACIARRPAGL